MSYDGPVVFVQGVHYPVGEDDAANLDRPLRWEGDGYRDAEDGEPLHNEVYELRELVYEARTDPGTSPGADLFLDPESLRAGAVPAHAVAGRESDQGMEAVEESGSAHLLPTGPISSRLELGRSGRSLTVAPHVLDQIQAAYVRANGDFGWSLESGGYLFAGSATPEHIVFASGADDEEAEFEPHSVVKPDRRTIEGRYGHAGVVVGDWHVHPSHLRLAHPVHGPSPGDLESWRDQLASSGRDEWTSIIATRGESDWGWQLHGWISRLAGADFVCEQAYVGVVA